MNSEEVVSKIGDLLAKIADFGGDYWTRFSAEKPRRLQRATGTLLRAAFRVQQSECHTIKRTATRWVAVSYLVETTGLEPVTSCV